MSISKKIIRGSMLRNGEFVVSLTVSLFMTPLIVHSLGNRMFGLWTLIGTFMGYYGLLDFGLSSAVSRFVSRALGENNYREINKTVNTSLVLFIGVGVISLIVTAVVALISPYFISNSDEVSLFRKIVLLLGLSLAIGFPMRVFMGILASFLRYDYLSSISVIRILISNLLIYAILRNGYGILAITIINFSASLFQYAVHYITCKRIFSDLRINLRQFSKKRMRIMFSYSGKTFIGQIADILRFKIDAFVIAGFLNLSLVTFYSIGAKLVETFGQLMMSSVGLMTTVFSQLEARGDFESIRRVFLNVSRISSVLSIFVGTSLIFYGKPFISRWMGPGFESSYHIALILCVPAIIALIQTPGINLLYGISKHHYYAVANICEGVLNLVLSVILVKYYGIYGVALGTAIEMIIFKMFIQPVFVCRSISLSLYEYLFKTVFITSVKASLPLLLYFYIVKDLVRPDFGSLCIFGFIQVLFYMPVAYFFVLGVDEKRVIRTAVGLTSSAVLQREVDTG